jgi:hypothetical protein
MVGELPSGLMVGLVETKKRAVSVTDTEPYSFPSVMEDAVAEGKRSLGGAPEFSIARSKFFSQLHCFTRQ